MTGKQGHSQSDWPIFASFKFSNLKFQLGWVWAVSQPKPGSGVILLMSTTVKSINLRRENIVFWTSQSAASITSQMIAGKSGQFSLEIFYFKFQLREIFRNNCWQWLQTRGGYQLASSAVQGLLCSARNWNDSLRLLSANSEPKQLRDESSCQI